MLGGGADILAHMPATLALGVVEWRRDDLFGFVRDD
jgi:hypothetical protein